MSKKRKAVVISTAVCVGKGKDPFKRVNGMKKKIIEGILEKYGDVEFLVPSNTMWEGETYKRAVPTNRRGEWTHRTAIESEYRIVEIVE